ncbi:hypothetical protein D9M72_557980 [compost metagenome]
MVGPGTDGADHLVRLRGGEDELDVFRRLFHDLEQGVEACRGDHVGFVDDEDLVPVPDGSVRGAFAEVPGVIHAAVARGVDLDHIEGAGAAARKLDAAGALAAGSVGGALGTVEAAGQDAGRSGLSATAGTGKQVGVVDAVLSQRRHQRLRDVFLPDNVSKGIWTVSAVKGGCNTHRENPTNPG